MEIINNNMYNNDEWGKENEKPEEKVKWYYLD